MAEVSPLGERWMPAVKLAGVELDSLIIAYTW